MAKQDINLGTQPTGVGGDTNRSANIKTNANLEEIYTALGGSLSGGNGSVLPASGLPVSKGGTGATTAAAARTNLGLGTVATATLTTSTTDIIAGRVLKVGDFGWGSLKTSALSLQQVFKEGTKEQLAVTQVVNNTSDNEVGNGSGFSWSTTHLGTRVHGLIGGGSNSNLYHVHLEDSSVESASRIIKKSIVRTEANTTIDANGFIKNASPIIKLFADRIELNDEAQQQDISFEKLDVGDYLIQGSSGFAQSGWYVEQPKDSNGNIYHAVVYETLENGDISVKTYEQKMDGVKIVADLDKPVDVKESRFISIRLQELPQPEFEEPQPDPTITDYQGNPAPSRLHELVDGTWTISGENAAILENERLSAMPALTRRQFRLALVLNGYNLADIETLINSIEDPMQRQITMIEWQDATTFHRTNPSLIVMAGLMGLDAETVDQLWLQASTL